MSELTWKWILAGLVGGASCGLAGLILVALNLPFMGVCLAHAALAGAVFAHWLSLPALPTALILAWLTGAVVGPLADRARMHVNNLMSILFSLMLGLAFLGIGLMKNRRSEFLGFLWGNLLLVQWSDLFFLCLALLLPVAWLVLFPRQIQAVLFDREIAKASGIPATPLFYALIALSAFTVTTNLQVVGGLMLYSLLSNPAVAALALAKGFLPVVSLSAALGAFSALLGLAVSWALDWPAGSSIVLVSSIVYAAALLTRVAREHRQRLML